MSNNNVNGNNYSDKTLNILIFLFSIYLSSKTLVYFAGLSKDGQTHTRSRKH